MKKLLTWLLSIFYPINKTYYISRNENNKDNYLDSCKLALLNKRKKQPK